MKSKITASTTRNLIFALIVILSGAFAPRFASDELLNKNALIARALNALGVANAASEGGAIAPTLSDPMRELQSGMRDSDEIAQEITHIAGASKPLSWAREFRPLIKSERGSLVLSKVVSHFQNLESRLEVMMIHNLPRPTQKESQTTFFTHRINEAEEKTIQAAVIISSQIDLVQGQPVLTESQLGVYRFGLNSNSLQRNFGLRDPDGTYEFSPIEKAAYSKGELINPVESLMKNQGAIDDSGNYQFDQKFGDSTSEVFINTRWQSDTQQLTVEVQIHESDSLTIKTFIIVYDLKS
jgi:hypothetical protein